MNFLQLLATVVVTEGAGGLGAIFTAKNITVWYKTLKRPALNPPNWIFAPVWTTLYLLMAIAAWLVWRQGIGISGVIVALMVFIIQLILNVLWSAIFFAWHNPGAAFAEIVLLWLSIVLTIFEFTKISPTAAWLMLPYIAWVTFAAYLNFAIWRLN
jgi:tryptophan-rich sensory protein